MSNIEVDIIEDTPIIVEISEGAPGLSGYSGYSGYSGFSGQTGTGLNAKGVWSGTETYILNDLVSYNNKLWISLINGNIGNTPSEGAYWSLFAEQGASGHSGYSGYSGISGYSGFSGFSGISGYSGYSGAVGQSGISGYSGYSGYSGLEGDTGIDSTPDNLTASGIYFNGMAGENLSFGDVVYIKSDGKFWKAKADSANTIPCLAMAIATITADQSGQFMIHGYARNDSLNLTIGGLVYVSPATAGQITQTRPSSSGNQVQLIGSALTDKTILFNPNLTYVEIA